ncbi:hypothetical protein Droror1_Dr00017921 [Drosera rotundifolia]
MNSIYLLLLLPLLFSSRCLADYGNYCSTNNNITSTTQNKNINSLLSQIVQKTEDSYFTAVSYGEGKNRVYGLAQCRLDESFTFCASCIQNATEVITSLCPGQADVRLWYGFDDCFLRYSNEDFFGVVDTSTDASIIFANRDNVSHPHAFYKVLNALFHKIDLEALQPTNKFFAKGKAKVSSKETIYARVQCTEDLSPSSCSQCLTIAIGNFQGGFCSKSQGCQELYSSCFVRYELYAF